MTPWINVFFNNVFIAYFYMVFISVFVPNQRFFNDVNVPLFFLFFFFVECILNCIKTPHFMCVGFSRIFRDIDAYSATLTSAHLGGKGDASPALSWQSRQVPDFGKKADCVHRWVKFSIQNIVLRVYSSISSIQNISLWEFFCDFDKMFIKVP